MYKVNNKDRLKICIVSSFPPAIGGMAIQAEKLVNHLKKEDGIEVYSIATNPKIPIFLEKIRFLRGIIRLTLFIINLLKTLWKIDVIHLLSCSYLPFFLFTSSTLIISKLYGKKVILNYRGGAAEDFFKRWSIITKPIINMSDEIIVPSNFLKDIFNKFGIETKIISNIVDFNEFKYKAREKIKPKIIIARKLEKIYNVKCGILAFEIIKRKFKEAELTILGTGSQEESLKSLVKELNLDGVKFLGKVDHKDIPKLYEDADILFNPSLVDNMPISILEAFAAGLPVISTNVGGVPYIIEDGINGLLVKPDDFNEMALKVTELLKNPLVVSKITQNGKDSVKKYTWEKIREDLLHIYKEKIN